MADKRFYNIRFTERRKCTLNIKSFKRKKSQFTIDEVFKTKKIASLKIHVKLSIGRVQKFHLFDGVLPMSLAPIDSKCFKVACWLTNFGYSKHFTHVSLRQNCFFNASCIILNLYIFLNYKYCSFIGNFIINSNF